MCGIAGIVSNLRTEKSASVIESMLCSMAHRGFDGRNIFSDQDSGVVLGHLRLAIIDLSDNALQPMTTRDGRYTITFNGEIYNYLEIMRELESLGVSVRSASGDTEVLLLAFNHWGIECLSRLRGMFAFAIWDAWKCELFCARDHLGIKPLYWWKSSDGKTLLFASELKALLASGYICKEANLKALAGYLQFYCVQPPATLLNGVEMLLPGHYLRFNLDGKLEISNYWNLEDLSCDAGMSYEDCVEQVRDSFFESVRLHLRSDVPVGLFLSGGLDSSALGGAMVREGVPSGFHTFSVGFDEDGQHLDESATAKSVADRLGSTHHHVHVGSTELRGCFDDFIDAIDQPSGDGLNSFFVSRAVSGRVKVVLSGLGADELFFGYRYMRELSRMMMWDNSFAGRSVIRLMQLVSRSSLGRCFVRKLGASFVNWHSGGDSAVYAGYRSLRSQREVFQLFGFSPDSCLPKRIANVFNKSSDRLNRFSRAELGFYTSGMLLRDSDATSMFSTLELRVPYLDRKFVETVLSMPSRFKLRESFYNKPLMVDALRDVILEEVIGLPKRGFEMPVGFWLRDSFDEDLSELCDIKWLNSEAVVSELNRFRRDVRNYLPLWSLLVAHRWFERHGIFVPKLAGM